MEEMWFCESLLDCLIESARVSHNTSFPGDESKALRVIALSAMDMAPLVLVVISRDPPRSPTNISRVEGLTMCFRRWLHGSHHESFLSARTLDVVHMLSDRNGEGPPSSMYHFRSFDGT